MPNSSYINTTTTTNAKLQSLTSGAFTVMLWVNLDSFGTGERILLGFYDMTNAASSDPRRFWISSTASGYFSASIIQASNSQLATTSNGGDPTSSYSANTWYHLTATFDNTTNTLMLIVNGAMA